MSLKGICYKNYSTKLGHVETWNWVTTADPDDPVTNPDLTQIK